MQLSDASLRRVALSVGWRQHRVEMLALPEGKVVVKGLRPPRPAWRFALMHALARWMRNPLLKPVSAPGGVAAQATEVRRLRALAAAGVPVPAVLHVASDHMVLAHIDGEPLSTVIATTPQRAYGALQLALSNLLDVHRRGQYLSQAFARNILMTANGPVYLDFEDDPLEAMTLADAQARDWLALWLSVVWSTAMARDELMVLWGEVFDALTPEVQDRIAYVADHLAWLRHLPTNRQRWGRDIVNVQALADFLYRWRALHVSP